MNSCPDVDELLCPDIPPNDTTALLNYACDTYGLVLKEDALDVFIPRNYEEEHLQETICDIPDLITRLQQENYRHQKRQVEGGKASFDAINEKLLEKFESEFFTLNVKDINLGLRLGAYSLPALVDVDESVRAFNEEYAEKCAKEAEERLLCEGTKDDPVYLTPKALYTPKKQTGPKINMGLSEIPPSSPKRFKRMNVGQNQGISSTVILQRPLPSRKQRLIIPDDDLPCPVISNVMSLAPQAQLLPTPEPVVDEPSTCKNMLIISTPSSELFDEEQENPSPPSDFKEQSPIPSPKLVLRKFPNKKGDLVYPIVNGPSESNSNQNQNSDKNSPDFESDPLAINPETDFASYSNSPEDANANLSPRSQINPQLVDVPQMSQNPSVYSDKPGLNGKNSLNAKLRTQFQATIARLNKDSEKKRQEERITEEAAAAAEKEQKLLEEQDKYVKEVLAREMPQAVEYLICRTCNKTYPASSDILYKNHMMTKHNKELDDKAVLSSKVEADEYYKCKKCGAMILTKLHQHYAQCYTGDGELTFDKAFEKILSTRGRSQINCGVCEKSYDTRIGLKQHVTGSHKDFGNLVLVDPNYRCSRCLKKYESSVSLTIHAFGCENRMPSKETVLELAKALLFCEVCEVDHESIEETQSCLMDRGLIRCVLCLHTVMSKSNFFHHMRIYHERKPEEKSMPCKFCGDDDKFALRDLFEHIVDQHYVKALNAAARTEAIASQSMPPPPPPPYKSPKRTNHNDKNSSSKIQSNQIVFNAARVFPHPTTITFSERAMRPMLNTAKSTSPRLRLIRPSPSPSSPSPNSIVVARSPQAIISSASANPTPPVRFVASPSGGTFQLMTTSEGLVTLVSPSVLATSHSGPTRVSSPVDSNSVKPISSPGTTNNIARASSSASPAPGPGNIVRVPSPANIARASSPGNFTGASSPGNFTGASSPRNVTTPSSPGNIVRASSPGNISRASSPAPAATNIIRVSNPGNIVRTPSGSFVRQQSPGNIIRISSPSSRTGTPTYSFISPGGINGVRPTMMASARLPNGSLVFRPIHQTPNGRGVIGPVPQITHQVVVQTTASGSSPAQSVFTLRPVTDIATTSNSVPPVTSIVTSCVKFETGSTPKVSSVYSTPIVSAEPVTATKSVAVTPKEVPGTVASPVLVPPALVRPVLLVRAVAPGQNPGQNFVGARLTYGQLTNGTTKYVRVINPRGPGGQNFTLRSPLAAQGPRGPRSPRGGGVGIKSQVAHRQPNSSTRFVRARRPNTAGETAQTQTGGAVSPILNLNSKASPKVYGVKSAPNYNFNDVDDSGVSSPMIVNVRSGAMNNSTTTTGDISEKQGGKVNEKV